VIPYGRQLIEEDDIAVVAEVLRSDWLTTGPKVEDFEGAFADFVGAKHAVAVSSGTAALHAAMFALGIGPGDEVIVPAMTFAATANCVVFQGGTPVFADVNPQTLLMDPSSVGSRITPRTKAIIAVDYSGQPCDYDALEALAENNRVTLVADACHSLGGSYKERPVGSLATLSAFSFHPVKHITTGEGGMIATDDVKLAERMRIFRNHGITPDRRQRESQGSWFYEMQELGYNYRITDFQCALGMSQLKKLPGWIALRREIAHRYDEGFRGLRSVKPLSVRSDALHA
jgi:perosamine synthetase